MQGYYQASPKAGNPLLAGSSPNGKDLPKPDSIGYGSLGRYFFALELCKHTGDNGLRDELRAYLHALNAYMHRHPSNNYSLFEGRAGAAWLNLAFYKCTQEEEFLAGAAGITRTYWDGRLKFFDKSGLVDGTAGTLLLHLWLHAETKQQWLAERAGQCILNLISRAHLAESGAYWSRKPLDNGAVGSWPSGNAGVAFALLEAGRYFGNDALTALAARALAWEDELPGPPADETAGRNLAGLYATAGTGNARYRDAWNRLAADAHAVGGASDRIGDGTAGWGLAFREAYGLTGETACLAAAHRIAETLSEKLSDGTLQADGDLHFFRGLAGVGYAMLKMADPDPSPSLLLPRLPAGTAGASPAADLPVNLLSITGPSIHELLIKSNFKGTCALLKRWFPQHLPRFLATDPYAGFSDAVGWVHELKRKETPGSPDQIAEEADGLADMLHNETLYRQINRNAAAYRAADTAAFAERTAEMLQLTDADLLSLTLVASDRYFYIRREARVDFSQPLTPQLLQEILTTYGSRSYLAYLNGFDEVESEKLFINRFYLDLFGQPAHVNRLTTEIIAFLEQQEQGLYLLLRQAFGAADENHLRQMLVAIILRSVRWLLLKGALEVAGAPRH